MLSIWSWVSGILAQWPSVCLQFKCCLWPLGYPAVLVLLFSFFQEKQIKTLMEMEIQKVKNAILEDFHWGSPGSLKRLFVALRRLYLLVCSDLKDQSRSRQDPPSSPQTQKWKVTVCWLFCDFLWGLWEGSDRALFALSSSTAWTSTVLKLMEIQAKDCSLESCFCG